MVISLRCTRLYVIEKKKKRDRGVILFELESAALHYPCPFFFFFFQNYMLGYGDHFDREYVCAVLSSSKERLDARGKSAIYLTGNYGYMFYSR